MGLRIVVAGFLLAAILAGCGGADGTSSAASSDPELVVFAASSLGPAFERYGDRFEGADVKFSFAGSDDLAAQIRQGVVPDVYAAANTSLPDELHADGLVGKPTTFATNKLVIGVPAGSQIDDVADLERPGVKIAIGDEDVPVGIYTREVLDALGPGAGRCDPRQRRQQRARRCRHRRQAHPGRGRCRVRLPQRRRRDRRSRRGGRDPAAGEPRRRLWDRRDDGRRAARARSAVHRRRRLPETGRTSCSTPASARRRDESWERHERLDRVSGPRGGGAGAPARLPGRPDDRPVRRDGTARARLQPRRARCRRGALAEPADIARRPDHDRRRRHAGRLADRPPRLSRPLARDHADRVAAGPAAGGGRNRAAGGVRAKRAGRRRDRGRGDRARPADGGGRRRPHLRGRAVLRPRRHRRIRVAGRAASSTHRGRSERGRGGRSCASRSPVRAPASLRVRRWPGVGRSASSERR